MLYLPDHIHLAHLEPDVIVLDIQRDRYRRLGHSGSQAIIAACAGHPMLPAAADELVQAGILAAEGRPVAFCAAAKATLELPDAPRPGSITLSLRTAFATLATHYDLRLHGLAALDLPPSGAATPSGEVASLATQIGRLRAWLPVKRRCLPDALTMQRLLRNAGHRTTLVFGVCDHPFQAHCWLQSGDVLLTGTLDEIAPFRPIFAA